MKILIQLNIAAFLFFLSACGDSTTEKFIDEQIKKDQERYQREIAQQNAPVALNRKDPATIISVAEIKEILDLSSPIEEEKRIIANGFTWENDGNLYDLEVSFWMPDDLTTDEYAEYQYTSLTTVFTTERNKPEDVTLGAKAQFSELGGGQLIVLQGKNILRMNLNARLSDNGKKPVTREEKKEILIKLGTHIINKL